MPDVLENEGEAFARENLVQVVVDTVNWTTLYRDPNTGEYWKQFYPNRKRKAGGRQFL